MEGGQPPSRIRRAVRVVLDYIPSGNTLSDDSFAQRHLLLCWVLGIHIPALFVYGLVEGFGLEHSALEVAVPLVTLACAQLVHNRRLAAFFVTAGLVFCSSVLVHLSGGTIEAHFHFFVLIGLIALYQDWVPFLWNVAFTVLSHGLGSSIAPDLMYNHHAAQDRPWSWAMIHGIAVLAACVGVVVFWKNTEIEQNRSAHLAATLAATETKSAQRQAVSDLFVNLARRNQSLLDRQLELIAELEQRKRTPEALAELFQLDHLATRIRRNAESLLVLSGDEPPRRWGRPIPLGEVIRAAAAEVEDYQRVDIVVNQHLEVAGRAVADLAHLLAELIENATRFSPDRTEVRVRSYLVPGHRSAYLLSVEDTGFGMPEADLEAANDILADPPEVDLRGRTMGFHVVARLARRYGLRVSLANTPGGGTTALVTLPPDLVSERPVERERADAPPEATPADAPAAGVTVTAPHAQPPSVPPPPEPPAPWPTAPAPGRQPAGRPPLPVAAGPWPDPPPATDTAPLLVTAATDATTPQLTADGLVRRVPGAQLSPALRVRSAPGGSDGTRRPPQGRPADRDQMRSMLSRFQASQRAGRAIADAPVGSLVHGEDKG